MDDDALARHRRLVQSLLDPACYPHPAGPVEHLETHISDVLLAGAFAYKLKKPVSLGFLDFGTPAARRHFCHEELRLNRRVAPGLYLAVVALRATPVGPRWDEAADRDPEPETVGQVSGGHDDAPAGAAPDTPALAHAVKMRRFAQSALFDRMLVDGTLEPRHVDALAERVAAFHDAAARSRPDDDYGTPTRALEAACDNFVTLRRLAAARPFAERLASLERWTRAHHADLVPILAARKAAGLVRECHGDLHSGNVAWVDDEAQPFDCIEFSAPLRWIDVASEIAFTVMDLHAHGRADLAARLLDRWLHASGDYGALEPLDWFVVYRALVRAKVAAIRADEPGVDEDARQAALASLDRHVALAETVREGRRPALVITHGVSGSGKSWLSERLMEATGAIRLRSDVERKRLHRLRPREQRDSTIGEGIYTASAGEATYARLLGLAREVLATGRIAIVDATFLSRRQRETFRMLARCRGVPFAILDCEADPATLRERILARARAGGDASEATIDVLAHQLRTREPLIGVERESAVTVSPRDAAGSAWLDAIRARLARAGASDGARER